MAVVNKAAENNLFVLTEQEENVIPYGWGGMPEFVQEDKDAYRTMTVRFRDDEAVAEFCRKIENPSITPKTKAIWYPPLDRKANSLLRWIGDTSAE